MNLERIAGDPLIRAFIGCYLSGYRIVELISKNKISNDQKIAIRHVTNRLISGLRGPSHVSDLQGLSMVYMPYNSGGRL
jgi:hypothetical protein